MDLHCDCAETPAADQPSGKINKAAFKLFGKRKSGSAMPTIFGVKSKGDGNNTGKMGMVRSKTLDGLADVVLESNNKKDEQGVEDAAAAGTAASEASTATDKVNSDVNTTTVTIKADVSSDSSVAKSHSFFNLLKKNGRSENVRGENSESKPVGRQKKGLKGLFNSMRWNRKEKSYKDDRDRATENAPGLILAGSLTASLECIKDQTPDPLCETVEASKDITISLLCEEPSGDVNGSVGEICAKESAESPCSESSHVDDTKPQEEDNAPDRDRHHVKDLSQLPDLEVEAPHEKEEENITGCGDIIADHDDEGGNSTAARSVPVLGNGRKAISKKTPNIVAYQGGGEEMASPEQVDDNYIQEIWGMVPPSEESGTDLAETSCTLQASGKLKRTNGTCDGNAAKPTKLKPIGAQGVQKTRGKEQQECVRHSDEGYWDSTTPCPEEEPARSMVKKALPRDSCSGDALYDLYTESEENTAKAQAGEEIPCLPHSKPLSPVTATCPVKTSFAKDSKIPISIKHLPVHPPSQAADSSSSSAIQLPVKSELPRTKIPVSRVLVRRVSNKAIAGTASKPVYHDPARK
ncbi:APC membrane recruitment protein 2 [Pelodytes ibericus]